MRVLWVELCLLLPKRYIEVLTTSTPECALRWEQVSCRYNLLKSGYIGVGPTESSGKPLVLKTVR